MKKTRRTKLAIVEIFFTPYLRKFLGTYETLDGKNFTINIRRKLSLYDFLETLYHELTHVVISLLEKSKVDTNIENLSLERGLVQVKIEDKDEEEICEDISKKVAKKLIDFLKKHASIRR